MKIEDCEVGMRVRVRKFHDLAHEYGPEDRKGNLFTIDFIKDMRTMCWHTATICSIVGHRIKLEDFSCDVMMAWMYSAEMLDPVEEFTMPPPPDLGELHGVKLPAWMWHVKTKEAIYVLSSRTWCDCVPMVIENELFFTDPKVLTAYTGQDLLLKHSVDELKALARLV